MDETELRWEDHAVHCCDGRGIPSTAQSRGHGYLGFRDPIGVQGGKVRGGEIGGGN